MQSLQYPSTEPVLLGPLGSSHGPPSEAQCAAANLGLQASLAPPFFHGQLAAPVGGLPGQGAVFHPGWSSGA
eukprot:10274284-Alexandrium_andersonii.AAC.1